MKSSKIKMSILFGLFASFLLVGTLSVVFWKEMYHISKFGKSIAKRQKNEALVMEQMTSTLADLMKVLGRDMIAYPHQLSNVICSEQLGVVKGVKKINFDLIAAPYNASIFEKEEGGYHVFFRHDEPRNFYYGAAGNDWKANSFYSHIGYAELAPNFDVVKLIDKIDTGSNFSEDPRIVKIGKSFYLSWNDVLDQDHFARGIHVGEWNPNTCKLEYVTNLQQYITPVEKNWVPFERLDQNKNASLAFVYGMNPHKIMGLNNPKYNLISHEQYEGYNALHSLPWTKYWGLPRGGTTARLIGKEYISFFHSSFKDGMKTWYVMGAYTFEAKAPHKITSITPCPILFPSIYTSGVLNTADSSKYCIFPAGLAVEQKDGETLLHVSCGENDSSFKIVTIDYKKLRSKMVSVK